MCTSGLPYPWHWRYELSSCTGWSCAYFQCGSWQSLWASPAHKGAGKITTEKFYLHIRNVLPPRSVTNRGTKCACCLARTLVNCLKSATLLRVMNSRSLSLRSRGCAMLTRWSLWSHVIQPTVGLASSLTKASLESMRSSSWTPFTAKRRMWAPSKGRTSPNSAPISAVTIPQ